LSIGAAAAVIVPLHRLTRPTSASFRTRASARYPAGWPRCPMERPPPICTRFPLAFRPAGLRFLSRPIPPETSAFLTVGLPPSTADSVGVSTFRACEMRPGWAPSMPRGDGVLPGGVNHPPGAYRISAVRPAPCSRLPPAGSYLTRRHRGFTVVRPSGLPLACRPRVEQGLLGFSPELRTPPLPATHVQVETGHRTRTRDYPVIGATADPLSKGQSTHHTRPRVARSPERCS
jgi:hypothetical protein